MTIAAQLVFEEPTLFGSWNSPQSLEHKPFTCGYCGVHIGHREGYYFHHRNKGDNFSTVRICSSCHRPTYFEGANQIPGPLVGRKVEHLPTDIGALYEEARQDFSNSSFTSASLILRKILMHLAVYKGAAEGLSFQQYVDYLTTAGFVPPDGKAWVDRIRSKGNEANHQIVIVGYRDADDVLTFTEMLLRFIYEMPGRLRPIATT